MGNSVHGPYKDKLVREIGKLGVTEQVVMEGRAHIEKVDIIIAEGITPQGLDSR